MESKYLVRNLSVSPLGGIRIAYFVKSGAGVPPPKRTLNYYTLVYVLGGRGSYEDETGAAFDIAPGDAILVYPGLEHWYGPPKGELWDEIFIEFEGAVFDLWREKGCLDQTKPVISLSPQEYWHNRIRQAIGESNDGDPEKMMSEALRLQSLLADIQHAGADDIEAELIWVEKAKKAIVAQEDPKAAAEQLGVAYEVFRKKFRKLAGMPPGKYKTLVLMDRAREMLMDRRMTLRVIASRLGYCDEYHFSKQFRKTVGWSPAEYRARIVFRQ